MLDNKNPLYGLYILNMRKVLNELISKYCPSLKCLNTVYSFPIFVLKLSET